ncbi:MAG: hypothetical protein ACLROI_06045 [Beduini sp.]
MEGTKQVLDDISGKLSDIKDQLQKIDADVLSVETILADIVADKEKDE